MKKILTLICLVTTVVLSSISRVDASHATGADLTYTYVSPNVIHVKLRFYRDCSGIPAPATFANIDISSVSCGVTAFTVQLPKTSFTEIITSDCIDTTQLTSCHGGPRYGVEEHIYEADVTLPSACTDWKFEFEECCRNLNDVMTGSPSLYVSTTLDNLNYPTNNSPQFLSYPATSFCVGNPFYYKQDAYDADGDSLVYSIVPAQGAGGAVVTYVVPYTGTHPIASSTGITIDQTGQINLTPSLIQTAVICVLVEEYRNGVLIGSVKRDIQVRVEALCDPNLIPHYNVLSSTTGIVVPCGTYQFDIPFKRDVQCGSITNDDFRVINSLGFPIPIDSIKGYDCIGGLTDSIRVYMSEPFTYGKNYLWTKTGSDGNTILGKCGFGSTVFDTIMYIVNSPTPWNITHDSVGCKLNSFTATLSEPVYCQTVDLDASSIQLIDAGNGGTPLPVTATFPYCGPSGDSLTNQVLIDFATQQTPTGPLYLIVKTGADNNTIANSCGRFLNNGDTLAVFNINNVIPLSLGNDVDACTNNNEVPVILNSGYTNTGGLNIQWYLNGSAIPGQTNPTYSASATGKYGVVVSSTASCRGSDSVDINVMNAPVINFGLDKNFCQGDSIILNMGAGGMIYQWYINGVASNQDTFPSYTSYVSGQFVGASIIYSVNGHFCFSSDTVQVTSQPYPVKTLSDQTVCSNTLPFVLDAGNPGATYLWSSAGATGQTLSVNAAGTYFVTVTNLPNCARKDSMILTVNQSPTATLPPTITQCASVTAPTLNPGSASTYLWSTGATSQTITPPIIVGSNVYSVTISNGTCSASAQTNFTVNAAPTVNALGTQTICVTDAAVTLDANYSGAGVSYLWSTGATTQTISTHTAGDYTVTVTESGCVSSDMVTLTIVYLLPAPVLTCGTSTTTGKPIAYTWNDIAGNSGYEVSYDGVTWIPASPGPLKHETDKVSPTFYVRAISNNECPFGITSESVACGVLIPSIITPDGNHQNDEFIIENIGFYPNNTFKIFDRWGKETYTQSGYNNQDKVFKGEDLPEGTYFYILDFGNGSDPKTGTLTISRLK